MQTTSVYIHIPFCTQKCHYCSFLSGVALGRKNAYIEAVLKEINAFYKHEALKTLYIGGGTPTLLALGDFERILGCFNLAKGAEVTVEVNPTDIELSYLRGLKELGVNRLSIGTQSFDDETLRMIGRTHTFGDFENVFEMARKAGFNNISIDLIYGLPNQTVDDWKQTLRTAIDFAPEHISLYGLKIEKGCYFYMNMPENLPDEDLQADMYLAAIEILKDYCHYEISNFAHSEEFLGAHNLNYWKCGYYYGIGLGASGYLPHSPASQNTASGYLPRNPVSSNTTSGFDKQGRYTNTGNLKSWQRVYDNTTGNRLEEEIFLGFRLLGAKGGVRAEVLEKNYPKQLKKFLETGHIIKNGNRYTLSTEGVLVSNLVLCEFV